MFAVVASRKRYELAPHLQLLDDYLYRLARGDLKRLMVFMPPRHGKSLLCSQYFPAWFIGKYKKRVILTSYEATFAASWGRLARDVLTEWGPQIWPDVRVAQGSSAADHWELEGADGQRGVMHTAGVGGAITGRGADLLIIDDPVKNAEEAASATYRDKAWSWYTSTAYTRLEPGGAVLVIQTRWHDDDLSGRILSESTSSGDTEPWTVLSLPAIAETAERYEVAGCPPFERAEGDPLWSDRFTTERLQTIRADVGGYVWSALYQQRPSAESGSIWHREWFQRYNPMQGGWPAFEHVIQTMDTASKTGVSNDYSVIATWGMTANAFYLVDIWRERVEYPDLKRALQDQAAKHNPRTIYIEDTSAGQAIIQELLRQTRLPIIPVQPDGSKEARAAAVSPLGEAGKIFLPEGPDFPWVADWIEEHVAFPRGAHDDMVDTTSMALEQARTFAVVRGPRLYH